MPQAIRGPASRAAFRHEDAFRQEVFLAVLLIPLALYLGETGIERALMIGAVLLVLIVELLNSAVEAAVDRISLEHHPLIKRAKDMGSAAVMIALVNVRWCGRWCCWAELLPKSTKFVPISRQALKLPATCPEYRVCSLFITT